MDKFNKVQLKNRTVRNDINSRMENLNKNLINYKEMNNKLINGYNPEINKQETNNNFTNDKKTFKNDINDRLNTISGDELFYKRLPLNNNIRDYNVTVDTNKDEFNNRLMNYNSLSNNINPNPEDETKLFTSGFHNNFKDDTNKRINDLSPLACNIGYPINKPKKIPDFNQNLEPEGNMSYSNYQQFDEQKKDDINKLGDLQYKRHLPSNTKQQFFFTNK